MIQDKSWMGYYGFYEQTRFGKIFRKGIRHARRATTLCNSLEKRLFAVYLLPRYLRDLPGQKARLSRSTKYPSMIR